MLGVPLGTALGQYAGWRSTFWAVTLIGVIALIGLWRVLPSKTDETKADFASEVRALRGAGLWLALSTTVLFSAAMFALFTYIAPLLGEVTGVSPNGVTWTLLFDRPRLDPGQRARRAPGRPQPESHPDRRIRRPWR